MTIQERIDAGERVIRLAPGIYSEPVTIPAGLDLRIEGEDPTRFGTQLTGDWTVGHSLVHFRGLTWRRGLYLVSPYFTSLEDCWSFGAGAKLWIGRNPDGSFPPRSQQPSQISFHRVYATGRSAGPDGPAERHQGVEIHCADFHWHVGSYERGADMIIDGSRDFGLVVLDGVRREDDILPSRTLVKAGSKAVRIQRSFYYIVDLEIEHGAEVEHDVLFGGGARLIDHRPRKCWHRLLDADVWRRKVGI